MKNTVRRCACLLVGWLLLGSAGSVRADADIPLIDAHIHYSHDAWEIVDPAVAISILRRAGLKSALVSSSSDEGTQKLYDLAPDLVIPVLRPYYRRGELYTWAFDQNREDYLRSRLQKFHYAGIGEFHLSGEEVDAPAAQAVISLAEEFNLFLHAHVDADAIHRIFSAYADARILWAHAGFEPVGVIRSTMATYENLWADLSFREELFDGEEIRPDWLQLFEDYPDRFTIGSDPYTPLRWFGVVSYASTAREWLQLLPADIAESIAWRNADRLLNGFWPRTIDRSN
ncbi:MAG: amidohydrolase [Pseudomonadota bacterium]